MKESTDFFMPQLAVLVVASMISQDLPAKSVADGLRWMRSKLKTVSIKEGHTSSEFTTLTVSNRSSSIVTVLSLLPVSDVSKKVDTGKSTLVVSIGARTIDWEFFSGRAKENEQ